MKRRLRPYGIALLALLPFAVFAGALYIVVWVAAPSGSMTIAAGPKGGAFEEVAYRYMDALAKSGIKLNIRFTEGMLDNYQLVRNPQSGVDFALLFGGITDQTRSPNLRSMGRVSIAPLWFFYRGDKTLTQLSDLAGMRIAVGPAIRPILTELLSASGVDAATSNLQTLAGADAAKALLNGQIDVAPLPFEFSSATVQRLLNDPSIRLMSMSQADALVDKFPYLSRLTLPRGAINLKDDLPAEDVNLVAIRNAIVIRDDLNPALIGALADALKTVHGGPGMFKKAGEFPTLTDPELEIPQQVIDYYRNGPPMLSKFVPFWLGIYGARALAIIIALFAIAVPLFSYVQTIYQWAIGRYLYKIYRDLGTLMLACEGADSEADLSLIEDQIADVDSLLKKSNPYLQYSGMALTVEARLDALRSTLVRKRSALKRIA